MVLFLSELSCACLLPTALSIHSFHSALSSLQLMTNVSQRQLLLLSQMQPVREGDNPDKAADCSQQFAVNDCGVSLAEPFPLPSLGLILSPLD